MFLFRFLMFALVCCQFGIVVLIPKVFAAQIFECGTYVVYGTFHPGYPLGNATGKSHDVAPRIALWEKSLSEQNISLKLTPSQKEHLQELGGQPFFGEFEIEIRERGKAPSYAMLNRFMPRSSYVTLKTGKLPRMLKQVSCEPMGGKSS